MSKVTKGKKDKPNFELLLSDSDVFFAQYPAEQLMQNSKGLFGFCASRGSLSHALIVLYELFINRKNSEDWSNNLLTVPLDAKNIILSLISEQNLSVPSATLNSFMKKKDNSPFSSLTIPTFVALLVQKSPDVDERLYTLAIRIFCSLKQAATANKLYSDLVAVGIHPHSRTFLPLLHGCETLEELHNWHLSMQKDLENVPTIDFYEAFFERFFQLTSSARSTAPKKASTTFLAASLTDTNDFLKVLETYRTYYPYITPTIAHIFSSNLGYRKNIKILSDGLVYDCSDPSNPKMPIMKLELLGLSYEEKQEMANCFKNSDPKMMDLTISNGGNSDENSCRVSPNEKKTNQTEINKFEAFVQKYEITWDIVLDGANVGLYNNSENFRYDRIERILKWARNRSYKVLVILHSSRKESRLDNFIADNQDYFSIYYTPAHHNDDHFALYAALTRDSFILSNDEFRDHTNFLKKQGINNFMEWRICQQIFYSFAPYNSNSNNNQGRDPFEIVMPSKFSRIIQVKSIPNNIQNKLVFAPVYDVKKNVPHYLENMDKIEGWLTLEL